jgi:hypothetical protein
MAKFRGLMYGGKYSAAIGGIELLDPRPCLFERVRIWGHSFLGIEALFVFFPVFPCLYLGLEAFFVFFCPAVAFCGRSECMDFIHSDRPRLFENQTDLPPKPYSLEKTGLWVE